MQPSVIRYWKIKGQINTHANNAPENIVEKNVLIFIPVLFLLSSYIKADYLYVCKGWLKFLV